MINVFFNNSGRGPGKVANNLLMGLKKLSIPFNSNSSPNKSWSNVILHNHPILYTDEVNDSFIGPNICVLPIDEQIVMNQNYKKTIVPSEWVKKLYMKWLPEDKIEIWPVGIDTDKFRDMKNDNKSIDCLIYFKRRKQEELDFVKKFFDEKNITYEVVTYGSYNEDYFLEIISKSKFGFVLDNTESQGIAIQEMMSCNLPLLVWDVEFWEDRGDEYRVNATSIPYWNESCGIKFLDFGSFDKVYSLFLDNVDNYEPRNFIESELNLEKSVEKLINILNK